MFAAMGMLRRNRADSKGGDSFARQTLWLPAKPIIGGRLPYQGT
jgi:hypothetical protein